MKKKEQEKQNVTENEKQDWQKVQQEAFEAGCIAKSLWLALNSTMGVELEDIEIGTLAQMIEANTSVIQEIAGNHL